jgi:PIN domain nuclease of toxin-antitoxin system
MNLLLDTSSFYWSLMMPGELSEEAREAISDDQNVVFVSSVCAWELAIKRSLRKIDLKPGLSQWLLSAMGELKFTALHISFGHVMAVEGLPMHHRDPFDRLLIAQAQTERLTLVTRDRQFEPYGVPVIWS